MVKKILLGLVVVLAILAIVIAMQPASFAISRSTKVDAPPAAVFEQVNDFHNWQEWSPWAKLDPKAKATFSGPESGLDSKFEWDGNSEVGQGKMTIVESKPNEKVVMKLEFIRPFEATNEASFTLAPEGSQTNVTWTMTGENNFFGKAMCLFYSMDKMVGGDFEKGLAQLKARAEADAKSPPVIEKPAAEAPAVEKPAVEKPAAATPASTTPAAPATLPAGEDN